MIRIKPNRCGYDGYSCIGIPELSMLFQTTTLDCDTTVDTYLNLPIKVTGFITALDVVEDMSGASLPYPEEECRLNTDPFTEDGFLDLLSKGPNYWERVGDKADGTFCYDDVPFEPGLIEPTLDTEFSPLGMELVPALDSIVDMIMWLLRVQKIAFNNIELPDGFVKGYYCLPEYPGGIRYLDSKEEFDSYSMLYRIAGGPFKTNEEAEEQCSTAWEGAGWYCVPDLSPWIHYIETNEDYNMMSIAFDITGGPFNSQWEAEIGCAWDGAGYYCAPGVNEDPDDPVVYIGTREEYEYIDSIVEITDGPYSTYDLAVLMCGGQSMYTFIGLTDTPDTYEGHRGRWLKVTDDEDGLEWADPPYSNCVPICGWPV